MMPICRHTALQQAGLAVVCPLQTAAALRLCRPRLQVKVLQRQRAPVASSSQHRLEVQACSGGLPSMSPASHRRLLQLLLMLLRPTEVLVVVAVVEVVHRCLAALHRRWLAIPPLQLPCTRSSGCGTRLPATAAGRTQAQERRHCETRCMRLRRRRCQGRCSQEQQPWEQAQGAVFLLALQLLGQVRKLRRQLLMPRVQTACRSCHGRRNPFGRRAKLQQQHSSAAQQSASPAHRHRLGRRRPLREAQLQRQCMALLLLAVSAGRRRLAATLRLRWRLLCRQPAVE